MQIVESKATCGAHNRDGSLCQHPAGFRTDHPGEGKCYLHGGKTPRGIQSPHFVHGRASRYEESMRESLRERIEALRQFDPYSLEDELLLVRALLGEILDQDDGSPDEAKRERMMYRATSMIEQITRTVERMVKMRNDTAITAVEVGAIAMRFIDILVRYIPEPKQQDKAIEEVTSLVGFGQEKTPR